MSITIESLKIELASLNKQIEEMKQEILANKKEIEEITEYKEEYTQLVRNNNGKGVPIYKEKVQQYRQWIKRLKTKNTQIRKELAAIRKQVKATKQQIKELKPVKKSVKKPVQKSATTEKTVIPKEIKNKNIFMVNSIDWYSQIYRGTDSKFKLLWAQEKEDKKWKKIRKYEWQYRFDVNHNAKWPSGAYMVYWMEKYFEVDKNDLYWEEKLISKMTDAYKYHLDKI